MEALNFENILGEEDIDNLFVTPEDTSAEETTEDADTKEEVSEEENNETVTTTEVDPDTLFEEDAQEQPESVGSEKKEAKEQGDAATEEGSDTSPQNFYSSIANALAVDGIFPNLDEETINKAVDAESFSDLIEAEVKARYDEGQQRILNALKNGVEPSDIRKYENTLQYISSISEAQIQEESEKGEQLRYSLIFQDFLNKGYSQEKAKKFTERTIDAGTDVEDAKEALQSNKEFFQGAYNKLLKDAQDEADRFKAERQKQAEKLKNSIMKDKDLLGETELSQDIRRKVYENISKPIYKDPETGEYLTALQKYEQEHHEDFIKYVGLFMTLTDGFKDFKSLAKAEVKKEMKKGLKDLERKLTNTRGTSGGNLRMVTGVKDDAESYWSKGMKLDI